MRIFSFLINQIKKTFRKPSRVWIIIANHTRFFPRLSTNLQKLRFAGRGHQSGTLEVPVALSPDVLVGSQEGVTENHHTLYQAGAGALNDLRIADAVRLLTRAVTLNCADSDIEKLWIRREAAKNLGVALHHGLGRLDEAVCWWRAAVAFTSLITKQNQSPVLRDAQIYDDFWSTHIGHTAILGVMIKRDILCGEADKRRYLVRAPAQNTGNPYLVEQMARFCTLADRIPQFTLPEGYTAAFGKFFWIDNRLSGPATYAWQVLAEVSRAWEEKGLGPLLAFSQDEVESIKRRRAALGVPPDAWHVCLHVRDSGYKHVHDDLHAALNADIHTYNRAIAAVVRRGGWVIRMGDPSMPRLPIMKNVIDYAHSPQKSQEMDILLIGTSQFFLGTSSGPLYVPALYGIPSVITNWFPTGTRPLNSNDLFIPKLHWYEKEEEFAPFDELMSQPLGHIHALPVLTEFGVSLRPNMPEEVSDVVEEMLDRLDGRAEYSAEDQQLQSQFDAVAMQSRSYGNAHVGRDFLRKYQCLLPSALTSRRSEAT